MTSILWPKNICYMEIGKKGKSNQLSNVYEKREHTLKIIEQ